MFLLGLILLRSAAWSAPAPETLSNITIALPEGATNHGNEKIVCTPASWEDILIFFLVNYVAHALTVVVLPGEGPVSHLTNALTSLLFPAFGAYRGLRAIFVGYETIKKKIGDQSSKEEKEEEKEQEQDLRKARRAGALCMIVRAGNWVPRDGDEIHENVLLVQPSQNRSVSTVSQLFSKGKIDGIYTIEQEVDSSSYEEGSLMGATCTEMSHIPISQLPPTELDLHTYPVPWTYSRQECPDSIGSRTVRCAPFELAPGYAMVMVPPCTPVQKLPTDKATDRIASAYDSIKGLVALGQAILAVRTLYETRGNQIDEYGYAAFGLTVAPYAIMSVINLLGALSRPDYDAVYLVGSSIMKEERERKGLKGYYDGVVGAVCPPNTTIGLSEYSTADEMAFLKSTVKFELKEDGLYARYTSSSPAAVETLVKVNTSQSPSFPLQKQTLCVPSMTPIKYHPTDPTYRDKQLLSNNSYALQDPRWPQRILPRSTRYLERSRNLSFLISLTPLIPIGILSQFRAGGSTVLQRAITMIWLAWGSFIGYLVAEFGTNDTVGVKVKGKWKASSIARRAVWLLLAGSPAVAGMAVVGMMLKEYGTCVMLPGM
jgi:hypothetical protein